MMDLQTIRELSDEAALAAKARGTEPQEMDAMLISQARAGDLSGIDVPNIGTYLPSGWTRVSIADELDDSGHGVYDGDNLGFGAYFCDASGFGNVGEPALTLHEFIERLRPGYGYAVIETGQFQVKVGVFTRSH